MISREFITELLADRRPRKELEDEAGVYRGVVRDILTGRIRPRRGDPRVLALGRVLALAEEQCFWCHRDDGDGGDLL